MSRFDHIWPMNYGMSESERKVRNIFDGHMRELGDRKLRMYEEINNWRDGLINQINNHAHEQTRLLDAEYERQKTDIESTRRQFVYAVLSQEHTKTNESIDELIAQCKAFKFELGAFQYLESSNVFIKFKNEAQVPRNNLGGSFNNHSMNDTSASSKETFSSSNQWNRQTVSTDKSVVSSGSWRSRDNNRPFDTNGKDVSIAECPVCSMFFSSRLGKSERVTHVNAH